MRFNRTVKICYWVRELIYQIYQETKVQKIESYRLTSIRDNLNNNESEERFVHRLNLERLTNEIKKESAHHLNLYIMKLFLTDDAR